MCFQKSTLFRDTTMVAVFMMIVSTTTYIKTGSIVGFHLCMCIPNFLLVSGYVITIDELDP